MALKDLLVHVDDSEAGTARVAVAIRLAQMHNAHLVGLYVMPPVEIPVFAEVRIPDEILVEQKEAARARAAKAKEAFIAATDKADLSSEWRFIEAKPVPTLERQGRYVDLVVVGQKDDTDPLALAGSLTEYVILDCGRPVLVIPSAGASDTVGDHVLVAWNASRESVRAVNDALPLLKQAQTVDLLAINPPGYIAGEGEIPSADICQHLVRHGVDAKATHLEAHDSSVGEMLLSRAADKGADLIVMGAYGHSRVREFVLGGATRHLLEHMTVPVLMAH
ncbi:MAG: universal stress protein [Gammaproteobacteria bacterium]|nr:universal stress protein [Gammaproteobacteria bacterium]